MDTGIQIVIYIEEGDVLRTEFHTQSKKELVEVN